MKANLLSNKQLRNITGGAHEIYTWFCTAFVDGEKHNYEVPAASAVEAADYVHAITGASQVNCTKDHTFNPTID